MKKGSALLVVLGMLAFMLISAVSFSAYMRYARLPSSFLRRSSATRLLAKAALAEAIDEIDAAIGNNPHPGVGTRQPRRGAGSLSADLNGIQNEDMRTRNIWQNRIYIGTNQLHQADDTVSTLTLEGLAYIPPALVNEARYYSRRSQAGIWKNLGFDSGRYAFCAIDVSDLFDVNVLSAKIPRNSSPSGRISLTYLFESDDHTSSGQDPKEWDKFLENDVKVRQLSSSEAAVRNMDIPPADANHVPFVSVADFNLAINDKKPLGWESPFCKFIESGGDFYTGVGATDPTGAGAEKVKRMSFVTESLFPQPSTMLASKATDLCDLANFDEQPFEEADLLSDSFPVERLVDNPTKESARRIANKTSFFGLAALYDYLDANNVPVSLALPTTERAPMICGIGNENMGGSTLTLSSPEKKDEPVNEQQGSRTMRRTTTYKIDSAALTKFIDEGTYKAVMAYPFRRGVDLLDPTAPFKFTLEGQLSVFFAREGAMNLRSGGGLLSPANNLFTDDAKVVDGVLRMPIKFEGFKSATFDVVQTDDNAVKPADAILSMSGSAKGALSDYLEQTPLLTVVEEWQQTKTTSPSGAVSWDPTEPPDGSVASADSALRIVTPGGTAEPLGSFLNGREEKLVVCSAVWLRVRNDDNKTVDLVPASLADDDALNGANNGNAAIIADIVGKTPLMLTTGNAGNALIVSSEGLKGQTTPIPLDFSMNVQCVDPRWNWAPEHWYKFNGTVNENTWLTAVRAFVNKDERDSDIFLSTSDAAYMQSVYELAFLPRFTDLQNYGNNQVCGNMVMLNDTVNTFETDPERVKNYNLMWKSYHPYATDSGAARDPFEDLKIVNDGGGFRINPYTEDLNVLMGAFANTPVDWWAASTTTADSLAQGKGKMQYISGNDKQNAQQFDKYYAFNEMNGDAKFKWIDLENVAKRFRELVRRRVETKGEKATADLWMDVFDGVEYSGRPTGSDKDPATMSQVEELQENDCMDWGNPNFCNVSFTGTDKLYDVDRKFLYGFWRECFAAKQQLFLIFVRAEPMMMGSGAAGQTPPQLGARAVALVWRDPTLSTDDQTPHRTRVLFYRQFD